MHHRYTIRALELYHHDLMNDLQIIDGYVKMNSLTDVQNYMEKWLDEAYQEQKLFRLNVPKLALFFIQFNHFYEKIRLTYNIDIAQKLTLLDEPLYNKSMLIIEEIKKVQALSEQVITINAALKDCNHKNVALTYTINCPKREQLNQVMNKLQQIKQLDVQTIEESIVCTYTHQL